MFCKQPQTNNKYPTPIVIICNYTYTYMYIRMHCSCAMYIDLHYVLQISVCGVCVCVCVCVCMYVCMYVCMCLYALDNYVTHKRCIVKHQRM